VDRHLAPPWATSGRLLVFVFAGFVFLFGRHDVGDGVKLVLQLLIVRFGLFEVGLKGFNFGL
jgi:hypothetical protein